MSMFDNNEKDTLYEAISDFLQNHSVSELLKVVTIAIEYEKDED